MTFSKERWQSRGKFPKGMRVRGRYNERADNKQLDLEAKQCLREYDRQKEKRPFAATRTAIERAADEARVKAIHWRQEQAELRLQRKIQKQRRRTPASPNTVTR
jgi:hypothetical protein